MTGSEGNIFLIVDIGTSDIKCACLDVGKNILAEGSRQFPMVQDGHRAEVDFYLFFNETATLLDEIIHEKKVMFSRIEALLITSQAQTFAPVDAAFTPLRKGIVWLDDRAREEADLLRRQFPAFSEAAGFSKPTPYHYVTKLLWLQQHEPDIFGRARAFPLINEFLAFRLTDKFYSDSTSAGMSGIFDYRSNTINKDLLKILNLTEDTFPMMLPAAAKGENITPDMRERWRLKHGFPVYLCGNDQGASACGAGLKAPGDVGINFGTAMVIYTITNSPAANPGDGQITGIHPVGNHYFLLNFEGDFGVQIRQLKEAYFPDGTYDELFRTYLDHPEAEETAPFSTTPLPEAMDATEARRHCAGVIKHYLHRLHFHLTQIGRSVEINNIHISGGMTRSEVWTAILRHTLDRPFVVSNMAYAGLTGALEIYLQRKRAQN